MFKKLIQLSFIFFAVSLFSNGISADRIGKAESRLVTKDQSRNVTNNRKTTVRGDRARRGSSLSKRRAKNSFGNFSRYPDFQNRFVWPNPWNNNQNPTDPSCPSGAACELVTICPDGTYGLPACPEEVEPIACNIGGIRFNASEGRTCSDYQICSDNRIALIENGCNASNIVCSLEGIQFEVHPERGCQNHQVCQGEVIDSNLPCNNDCPPGAVCELVSNCNGEVILGVCQDQAAPDPCSGFGSHGCWNWGSSAGSNLNCDWFGGCSPNLFGTRTKNSGLNRRSTGRTSFADRHKER